MEDERKFTPEVMAAAVERWKTNMRHNIDGRREAAKRISAEADGLEQALSNYCTIEADEQRMEIRKQKGL